LPPPLRWTGDSLELLDQRRLPAELVTVRAADAPAVAAAIRDMVVRGAPAIGIAAAYGVALGARVRWRGAPGGWRAALDVDLATLAESRPTAVNLFWALDRMRARLATLPDGADPFPALRAEAEAIHAEDLAANRRMGELGAAFLAAGSRVLTHCNTGALATGGHGTALGVIRSAWAAGRLAHAYCTETRPWLQGARLTALELAAEGIPATLVVDGAAAHLVRTAGVAWLIVGADRVAANGDVANKIGTCTLAAACRALGARVMVVAPRSTVDLSVPSGDAIRIEERDAAEIWRATGAARPPAGLAIVNPAFDVTPAALIDVLVTEHGCVERPDAARLARFFQAPARTA
jgi:methylthioribose-1-phosphate isomerase